jgi:alpha-L-rhamnosidase
MILHSSQLFGQITVHEVLCENIINPLGIDNPKPRLSWQLVCTKRNTLQTAYEIHVGIEIGTLSDEKKLLWNTGKVNSDASVYVRYNGPTLLSGKKYFWKVRVWDNHGNISDWSSPAFWQMGLLDSSDWKAKWISPGYREDTAQRPCPLLRKEFTLQKKIESATVFITAHGLYEAMINGKRIGDAWFTPGWTSYDKRLQYQAYDVTSLVNEGRNAIGVTIVEVVVVKTNAGYAPNPGHSGTGSVVAILCSSPSTAPDRHVSSTSLSATRSGPPQALVRVRL